MKMLVDRIMVSTELPFVLSDLKFQLRLSFDDEDDLITKMGMAAAHEVEEFAQIALLTQTIKVTIFNPDQEHGLRLPIGPVADIDVPLVSCGGQAFTGFDFVGGCRPYIFWRPDYYDLAPSQLEIEYQAGFGSVASDIPDDLYSALLDQTALHFDGRSPMDARSLSTSPHMARIGAKYRGVQV